MTAAEIVAAVPLRMEQWPGEIVPFVEWLQARQPVHVVELGVRQGGTAWLWHQIASGCVIGVDWVGRDSLGQETLALAKRMKAQLPRYNFVCGDTHNPRTLEEVRLLLPPRPQPPTVDFLFIDADHSYAGVKKDLEMYRTLVRPGGVIAFHDIVDTPFIRSFGHGVYRLWQELSGEKHEFCVRGDWGGIGALVCE